MLFHCLPDGFFGQYLAIYWRQDADGSLKKPRKRTKGVRVMTLFKDNQRLLLLVFGIVLFLGACQKKCQQPASEKFNTISATEWRLVETTDPDFKGLNNTTFLIFSFGKNYTGAVNKVLNNDKYDTPVFTFLYQVDPDQNLLRIQYQEVVPEPDPATGSTTPPQQPPALDPVDYTYELGRELEMTNSNGRYYRFVPFQGIVDPDNLCSF